MDYLRDLSAKLGFVGYYSVNTFMGCFKAPTAKPTTLWSSDAMSLACLRNRQ